MKRWALETLIPTRILFTVMFASVGIQLMIDINKYMQSTIPPQIYHASHGFNFPAPKFPYKDTPSAPSPSSILASYFVVIADSDGVADRDADAEVVEEVEVYAWVNVKGNEVSDALQVLLEGELLLSTYRRVIECLRALGARRHSLQEQGRRRA
jgi:hypothetical protein